MENHSDEENMQTKHKQVTDNLVLTTLPPVFPYFYFIVSVSTPETVIGAFVFSGCPVLLNVISQGISFNLAQIST